MQNVDWTSLEDVVVNLHTEDHGSFQGIVVETIEVTGGDTRVVADFPRTSDTPNLPIGEDTALIFSGASLDSPLQVSGRVFRRSDDHFRTRYLFQFENSQVATLSEAIEHRSAPRVRPEQSAPIEVFVEHPDSAQTVACMLEDVSATGLSLRVSRDDETTLCNVWSFPLSFQLPGHDQNLEFHGVVRSRKLHEGHIYYGIEFDPVDSKNFSHFQERVVSYVMLRQVERFRQASVIAHAGRAQQSHAKGPARTEEEAA